MNFLEIKLKVSDLAKPFFSEQLLIVVPEIKATLNGFGNDSFFYEI